MPALSLSQAAVVAGVDAVAHAMAKPLTGEARAHLAGWLDKLLLWNARIDLTAARGADELLDLMLADAFVLASSIARDARVVDVGSGAGAPGLPLAILRPDLQLRLVEPLAKRVSFLVTVVGERRLSNVRVERGKGESTEGGLDVAISRATLAPEAWLALGAELAPEVHLLLAKSAAPSLSGLTLIEELEYAWPMTGAGRRLARYRRS